MLAGLAGLKPRSAAELGRGRGQNSQGMRAMSFQKKGGPEDLCYGEVPPPRPQEDEILVEVRATTVMPTELQWSTTWAIPTGQPRPFPIILSHEFSGRVAELGPKVTALKPGDQVYGMNDWFSNGAQAQFCTAPASAVAPKPTSLEDSQAAVVPISALTAWQGLFDHAHLGPGQRVLIHGAAGAVGGFAVQLAHGCGAYVIATASSNQLDFVRGLGADQVIDYKATRFEAEAGQVDAVFDTVGGETLERSWGLLKPGGKLVTIATQSEGSSVPRVREAFFIVEPDGAQLAQLSQLIDTGKLRPTVDSVFPLERAPEAYEHAKRGHLHGKVALRI